MRPYIIALSVAAIALGGACAKQAPEAEAADTSTEAATTDPVTNTADSTPPLVGMSAPAITVANSHNWNGDLPVLDDLRGKVVVLDFWAYW